MQPFVTRSSRANLGRLAALIFSILIPLSPILIVAFTPPPAGGVFILGFLTGAFAAMFIFLGALRSADTLFRGTLLNSALGVMGYMAGVVAVSVLAALWSFYAAQ